MHSGSSGFGGGGFRGGAMHFCGMPGSGMVTSRSAVMPAGHHRFFFRHPHFRHPPVLRSSLRLVGHTSTAGERYGLHTAGKERTFAMFKAAIDGGSES